MGGKEHVTGAKAKAKAEISFSVSPGMIVIPTFDLTDLLLPGGEEAVLGMMMHTLCAGMLLIRSRHSNPTSHTYSYS